MQEQFAESSPQWHSALHTDARTHSFRVRVYDELLRAGVSAPRTLVADAAAAICSSSMAGAKHSGRTRATDVASRMHELKRMYERRKDYVSEALDGEEHAGPSFERRVQYLIPFLATWFANAPKPEHLSESIVELDRAALGIIDGAAFRSKGWMQWRSNE